MKESPQILFAWIGGSDRKAAQAGFGNPDDLGAIANVLTKDSTRYDKVILLSDDEQQDSSFYERLTAFLNRRNGSAPELIRYFQQVKPMDRPGLYTVMKKALDRYPETGCRRSYILSSGTSAMHLCWTLLAHTERYRARLIDVSREKGVEEVAHWIELSHAFMPVLPPGAGQFFFATGQALTTDDIIGNHPDIHCAKGLADSVAKTQRDDYPVLILGETGTGKEAFARLIHQRSDPPKGAGFEAINCSEFNEQLLESALFGHVKGAFTDAHKDRQGLFRTAGAGGTVFLDEIGDMPTSVQTKLLRVLQEKEIRPVGSDKMESINNIRIVAATHKSLIDGVAEGWFREDLYYRLNVIEIRLPPLRERRNDLKALAEHFLAQINRSFVNDNALRSVVLSDDALQVLLAHQWPGNIRELQNTLRRAALFAQQSQQACIDADLLRTLILPSPSKAGASDWADKSLADMAEEQEKDNTWVKDWAHRSLADINLNTLLDEVRLHYYQRFYDELPGLPRNDLAQRMGLSLPTLRKLEDNRKTQGLKVRPRQTRVKK